MALVAAVFTVLGRIFGRVANMGLGWATVLLFGRIPQAKQSILASSPLAEWVAAGGLLLLLLGDTLLALLDRVGRKGPRPA